MLKAQVGLSRKISLNFNSTGYSVHLEGEIQPPLDHPDAILEQIDRLFELAEQAIEEEMYRDRGVPYVIGQGRDAPPAALAAASAPIKAPSSAAPLPTNGRPAANRQAELATPRQIKYLETLGKRQGWSLEQLEERVAQILGRTQTIQELDKKEAGKVIEELVRAAPVNGRT